MLKMVVLASGRGSNFIAIADAVNAGQIDGRIEAVLSDKAEAKVLTHAKKRGIPARAITRTDYESMATYEEDLLKVIESYEADVLVLAGYMRIIGGDFLKALKIPVLNIHPSLLPAFPGLSAQKQAIDYGVQIAGCTVHYVDESLDGGPIIAQKAVDVLPNDDEESLSMRILVEEHKLYPEVLAAMAEGRIKCEGRRVRVEVKKEEQ